MCAWVIICRHTSPGSVELQLRCSLKMRGSPTSRTFRRTSLATTASRLQGRRALFSFIYVLLKLLYLFLSVLQLLSERCFGWSGGSQIPPGASVQKTKLAGLLKIPRPKNDPECGVSCLFGLAGARRFQSKASLQECL